MNNTIKHQFEPKSNFIKLITYSFGYDIRVEGKTVEAKINEKINIEFKDGKHLEYSPEINFADNTKTNMQDLYTKMCCAESVGKFYHKFIKDKLPVKRIR